MADTTAQGTTAATPTFNFAQMASLMHSAVFERGAIDIQKIDYSAYCDAVQAVDDAAICLKRTEAGISMLLTMLDGSDMEQYFVEAMRGLLGPIAQHLEHHSKALGATIQKNN